MSGLTFGSLFAGIGGMDLGLERAGWECRWQVEIDDYATRVLEKHWPHVERFRDIRDCGAINLAAVDLIAGGFPCQDISNAGKRAGITGERSGLWTEFARVVRELRPRYVLVENVTALLGRGTDTVLGDLAACGYDAEWECIPAAAVGAPHIRDRVFILAYACGERRQQITRSAYAYEGAHEGWPEAQAHQPASDGEGDRARDVAHAQGQRAELWEVPRERQGRFASGGNAGVAHTYDSGRIEQRRAFSVSPEQFAAECIGWWDVEPGVGRVVTGLPHRVDRLRGLGNAVVPQVAEWVGRQILAHAELMAARLEEAG